mmetsp:Transcript_17288/g.39892  ORF Transcript_17288/g.39892 Transcript_17288/m.39892 type:complete len:219 (+) Transcript_17288:1211-1867(+)
MSTRAKVPPPCCVVGFSGVCCDSSVEWEEDARAAVTSRAGSVQRVSLVNLLNQKGLPVLRDVKTFHREGSADGSMEDDWPWVGDPALARTGIAENRSFALTLSERSREMLLEKWPGSGDCQAGMRRATSRSFARRESPTPRVCIESSAITFSAIRRDTSARSRSHFRSISDRRPLTRVSTSMRRAFAFAPGSNERRSRRRSAAVALTTGSATVLTGSN